MPYGYDPTFYPHRLYGPLRVKKPSKIFVVDVGDAFGKWVPKIWIEKILDIVNQCPHHTFQFLTKNPKRYLEFEFPDNAWVGTSINSDEDKHRVDILHNAKAHIKYLSIEPLLGEVSCLDGVQWIIVGAQTGKNPIAPKIEWIERILKLSEALNIPVFMKGNLNTYYTHIIQHVPK